MNLHEKLTNKHNLKLNDIITEYFPVSAEDIHFTRPLKREGMLTIAKDKNSTQLCDRYKSRISSSNREDKMHCKRFPKNSC